MRAGTIRYVLLFAAMLTVCGSARATITGIRGDGCSSPGGCSASFVLPVMRGRNTNVNIDGDASDLCGIANTNGVEVSGSGVTVSSLNRSPLDHRDYLGIWLNVDAAVDDPKADLMPGCPN